MTPQEATEVINKIPKAVERLRFDIYPEMTLNKIARSNFITIARYKKDYTFLAKIESQDKRKFKGQVWVELFYFIKRNIDPIDNLPASMKPIFDGMVEAGVIKDDSTTIIQSPTISWFIKFKPKKKEQLNFVVILISKKPIFKGQYIEV